MQERFNDSRQNDRTKAKSSRLLAAGSPDTWIGKAPHRVLYHCSTPQRQSSRVLALREDYPHEYVFVLDNGLNQAPDGHILFK
jgi:hypothetical protein